MPRDGLVQFRLLAPGNFRAFSRHDMHLATMVRIRPILICLLALGWLPPCLAGEVGANKVDLMADYFARTIPQPGQSDGYVRIRRLMAEKALADAQDAGLGFLRVEVTGYRPVDIGDELNDLKEWQDAPASFWKTMDEMFNALDDAHLQLAPTFIWSLGQFPSLGGDTISQFVRDAASPSRQLLDRFITEFITRYKDRNTILFYELTNEMNLAADLDLSGNCRKQSGAPCIWDHFSTDEMIEFSRDVVSLIKSLDHNRLVSSGYALPRAAAAHLMLHPGFLPQGPDWRADTKDEFRRYLLRVHQPFDIVSVHVYPGADGDRFGRPPGEPDQLAVDAASAARAAGKKLFIGEFGDQGATPFIRRLLADVIREKIDYAAIWVWEFYQTSTYRTYDTEPTADNVEPGYSDELIGLLGETQRSLGHAQPSRDPAAPPRVVLTWPLPCANVERPLDLAAVASDGAHGVKSVDFLIDGNSLATVTTLPYATHFDPAKLGGTTAQIVARAISQSGTMADFESTVRLNGNAGPCTIAH